ncbi:MAG TPA: serine protease [Balneolaceae bacterium]|nr:serine protease [Balneolaceae bacterium]
MVKGYAYLLLISLIGFSLSCSTSKQTTSKQPKPSQYYTTSFPTHDVSKLLKDAQESILRILVTSSYNTYTFADQQITLPDIKTNNPKDIAVESFSSEQSTAGTAIILQYNLDQVLLITCNHVVSSPDTVINYYKGEGIPEEKFIKSISIKQRQNNLIFSPKDLQGFDVITSDSYADLALLSTKLSNHIKSLKHPLTFDAGNNDFLQMGSFLYVMGYPKGYLMLTRGIASNSEPQNRRFFVSDALFNPGISGGLVFATNDNFQSFEWLGMARSAAADNEDYIVPKPEPDKYGQIARPYNDSLFVQQKTKISYGITQAIPINGIKNFLNANRKTILRNGFTYLPK